MNRPRPRYVVTVVVAVVALAVGLLSPLVWAKIAGPSAKDRIEADPPPTLYSSAQIKPVDAMVTSQDAQAHQLMQKWWKSHGRGPDDKAFAQWLVKNFPKPPQDRKAEMSVLEDQKARRTDSGVMAATWLEAHGKKDIWKLYAHDQAEWLPAKAGDARKKDVKQMLKLAKNATDGVSERYRVSSPYVLDRGLLDARSKDQDPILKLKSEKRPCPCSYPAGHAAKAAAARTYLGELQPHMLGQYRWMESEIDWSRIYMAGHLPSDVSAGALLGDMIGEYFAVTRGGFTPDDLAPGAHPSPPAKQETLSEARL